ncbi:MAG: FtsX-like permease family protein [Polyangiaceae bacterium]
MNLISVAAKNAGRNKGRTFWTMFGASFAIILFVMLRTVLAMWNLGVEAAAKDRIATRHKVSFILPLPKRYVDDVRGVPGVQSATFACWFGAKEPNHPNEFFATLAVDPKTIFQVMDEMVVDGAVLSKWQETRQGAIVGDVIAKKFNWKVGDRIKLVSSIYPGDWEFEISGIYQATRKSVDRSTFIFQWDYLNEKLPARMKDNIGWIQARIDDPSKGAEISKKIDQMFDERDVQTATMSEKAMNLSSMAMLSAILKALDVVSVVILLVLTLILGNTIAMGVRERTNEYGVLRAIGFRPKHIAIFILGEAATVGLLAGLLGLLLAYPIVELGMGRFLEENMGGLFPYFRIEKTTMVAAVFLSMGLSLAASALPAWRASKLPVTEALRRIA